MANYMTCIAVGMVKPAGLVALGLAAYLGPSRVREALIGPENHSEAATEKEISTTDWTYVMLWCR